MAIQNVILTDTQLDALTVPAGKSYAITNVLVCNTYSPFSTPPYTDDPLDHDASFDMHIIPSSGSLNIRKTCVVRELALPAGETFTFDSERIVLEEGDTLTFVAQGDNDYGDGTTDLSATISYLEV